MTTTIPSTDEEINSIEREDTCCCCTINFAAICVSLHGIISTLLLPLTVQGPIGGQHGTLIVPERDEISHKVSYNELLTLTDMPVGSQVFLISLLFIGHLIGFISVIKKCTVGLVFYFFFRFGELLLCFFWLLSVFREDIKSHLMSQYSLGWYCFFAFVMGFICFCTVFVSCGESLEGIKTRTSMRNHQVP